MSGPTFTVEEQLTVIDRLIEDFRWARSDPAVPEHHTLAVLKSIHIELSAHRDGASNRTLDALAFQINAAAKSKVRIGYVDVGHQQAVYECVAAHWPVVRLALEQQGKTTQQGEGR